MVDTVQPAGFRTYRRRKCTGCSRIFYTAEEEVVDDFASYLDEFYACKREKYYKNKKEKTE